jgi:hypothetical protein
MMTFCFLSVVMVMDNADENERFCQNFEQLRLKISLKVVGGSDRDWFHSNLYFSDIIKI